jgi:protein ImuA
MSAAHSQILETLQEKIRGLESAHLPQGEFISTGFAALDRLLPQRGFCRGTLVEWLGAPGGAAGTLAAIVARQACRDGAALVVVDPCSRHAPCAVAGSCYPPALLNLGFDPAHIIFVHPQNRKDYLWALNQSLASRGVGAVLSWPQALDDRAFRGLQLAAEKGGGLGLLVRPVSARGQPTWSEVQLWVEPLCSRHTPCAVAKNVRQRQIDTLRRLRIELLRLRGGKPNSAVELELDDERGILQESRSLHLASQLAVAAGM